jgi:DNA-directed RNA polymerase subunit RPC12/RpoP
MDMQTIGSQFSGAWRRCASCGRFFSFPQWRRIPGECQACGSAMLVPTAPSMSFWRLMDD